MKLFVGLIICMTRDKNNFVSLIKYLQAYLLFHFWGLAINIFDALKASHLKRAFLARLNGPPSGVRVDHKCPPSRQTGATRLIATLL